MSYRRVDTASSCPRAMFETKKFTFNDFETYQRGQKIADQLLSSTLFGVSHDSLVYLSWLGFCNSCVDQP